MARTGRPKVSDDPRLNRITLRVSNAELDQIESYSETHNLPKAEVLRKGLEILFEQDKENSQ